MLYTYYFAYWDMYLVIKALLNLAHFIGNCVRFSQSEIESSKVLPWQDSEHGTDLRNNPQDPVLRQFVGLDSYSYFSRFGKDFAAVASSLYRLTGNVY